MNKLILGLLSVGLLAFSTNLSQAKIERVVEKTFAVDSGGTLKVRTVGGDVEVKIGQGNQVRVRAHQHINTNSESKADELLQHLELTMAKTNKGVELEARYAGRRGFTLRSWPPVQVSFDVMVPAHYHADLRTSGGEIEVDDLGGNLVARTSGGDIDLDEVAGNVQASTSGGDIEVDHIGGSADLATSGGDIEIESVSGSVRAETSGGSIDTVIKGPLLKDCKLATSGGDVKVKVDPQARFHLDASTSGGDVEVKGLAIKITRGGIGKNRLSGDVNGGGPVLKLRTSGGDIDVEKR